MPLMDMPRYLDYLGRRLAAAGGEIEQRRVRTSPRQPRPHRWS
jgi:D-amino-acid oxidase